MGEVGQIVLVGWFLFIMSEAFASNRKRLVHFFVLSFVVLVRCWFISSFIHLLFWFIGCCVLIMFRAFAIVELEWFGEGGCSCSLC